MKGKMFESEFEEAFIQRLQANGWSNYSCGEELHRQYTDTLLEDDLRDYLKQRYASKGLNDSEYDMIVANLRNVSGVNDYLASLNAFSLYRDGFDFKFTDGRSTPFKLEYIDFNHPEHNIFRVVNQFEMHQGQENRRPDVLLFINGIPVCIIELKNPTDEKATIREAHTQITVRYRRDIHSLLKYCALACISDGSNSRLGTVYTPYEYFYAWKKVNNTDEPVEGLAAMESLIAGVFAPERLLEILRDYVYFPDAAADSSKELEVVCRYPQFFATRMLRDHILLHLRSCGGDGKGGTYFGATGCGKTYTMLFLSRQLALRCKEQLGSPTILLIVDREDLENQAEKLFCSSKTFLADEAVSVFESRNALGDELKLRNSGGFFITTIQKFSETTGLLSDRSNIICMSDEAHRSQNNIGRKLKIETGDKKGDSQELAAPQGKVGAFVTYGFAKYLRDALPNATYVGFTGTPIDETIHVFGEVVDRYTMIQSQKDGITVPIKYDPRLARVFLNEADAKKVEDYYRRCEEEGATAEDVDKSKELMSSMETILGNEERLRRVARDIVTDYEARCANQPDLLQKAMITCSERNIAYRLYKLIREIRPQWCEPLKALDESTLSAEELEKLKPVRFLNLVTTRDEKKDCKEQYELCGDEKYRKELDAQFKNEKSNFHIAIVVDMWITGFDAPPLTILYNDKPLQKHTLIQTISRVNRKYKSKEFGYIVDYIGIRENMKEAMKKFGGDNTPTQKDDLETAHDVLKNELEILRGMTSELDFAPFFGNDPLKRLYFLQTAAEFILASTKEAEKGKPTFLTLYKGHVNRLRAAFVICHPAGVLSDEETAWAQCFMGILSYLKKITDTVHDVESMNRAVEKMVKEAITCSGVESVLDMQDEEDIFGERFIKELNEVRLPNTKFQILVKMLQRAIKEYSKTNKVRADHFDKLLKETVDEYNKRDKLTFTNKVASDAVHAISGVVEDKVKGMTDKLLALFRELKQDKEEFKKLGISFQEKAFFDILVDLRDTHKFEYPDEKCVVLAQKIKALIDGTALYADWLNNDNLKNQLASDLTYLIYQEGYPPEWDEEIFKKVLEQVENFKKFN